MVAEDLGAVLAWGMGMEQAAKVIASVQAEGKKLPAEKEPGSSSTISRLVIAELLRPSRLRLN